MMLLSLLALAAAATPQQPPQLDILAKLRDDAELIRPLFQTKVAQEFLDQAKSLPQPPAKLVYISPDKKTVLAQDEYRQENHPGFTTREINPTFYYMTLYGGPLAYARVLDVAGKYGLESLSGRRVFDFGYGTIGQLKMMSLAGASAIGVDVNPLFRAAYASYGNPQSVGKGTVQIADGFWPGQESTSSAVGTGFDLITSKNTLKRGYIHPEREAPPEQLVQLGVSDEEFLKSVHRALKPGGLFVIYNLSPKPSPPDKPYIPWADGRCPFDKELIERAGFEVLAFDVGDDAVARQMGVLLGWGSEEQLADSVFGLYTVLRRK
jgi:SAM-dependent methyltransferase